MLEAQLHEASIQDRDGAPRLIESVKQSYPSLGKFFADGGYAGEKLVSAISHVEDPVIEIVKRFDAAEGFVVLPKSLTRNVSGMVRWRVIPSTGAERPLVAVSLGAQETCAR